MITREIKAKILERFNDNKEEKILISNVLDKAYRFNKTEKIEYTNFLNIYEQSKVISILNELSIECEVLPNSEHITKKIIFFKPSYIEDISYFADSYINCIKIIPDKKYKEKIAHRDYMGTIYSLGIKREMIGDIFVKNGCGYFFCMSSVTEYVLTNLQKVSSYKVEAEVLELLSDEVVSLKPNLEEREYIVPSNRVDACLSDIYNLSRNEVKEKIVKGDLHINDRNIIFPDIKIYDNDIISFKGCGKFKFGKILRTTKSDNLVIQIYRYV